ncbi:syntaxin-61-like isoform X1 [Musa acuminata AAA Group]|uniref:syntaxin-61-like isoform X1 n=2 Tax=Musa acuminata AAA Group TaxID=214697 RepID=UPI0031DA2C66
MALYLLLFDVRLCMPKPVRPDPTILYSLCSSPTNQFSSRSQPFFLVPLQLVSEQRRRSISLEECAEMTPAQDPFYVVKEEIQESINKLQVTFQQWEQTPSNTGESVHLTKQLVVSCESIEWQVDELDMAIAVAVRNPAWYGLDEVELEKRRRWTSTARYQVGNIRKTVEAGKEKQNSFSLGTNGVRKELMGLRNDHASQAGRSNNYINQDNDDFISSESDQQLLLIKENLLDEFGMEMETTSNRLDFVQKKVAKVMKKAGAKGQIMMIAFLIVLFIILLFLVFFT